MLIVGAKGFAKEVLQILHQLGDLENVVFFDNVNPNMPEFLYDKFRVLKTAKDAEQYFADIDKRFTVGIGNPILRRKVALFFEDLGGVLTSTISPLASVGDYGNAIASGCNIMTGTVITNDVIIGRGSLVNLNCTIGHDTLIGDFVEISPGVNISGNCKIGSYSVLGTNCIILPNITIGSNVVIGAGSVITKDVGDNSLMVGMPGVIKKQLESLTFL